ncbi:MAG: hypothetical protein GXP42_09410 [Chloroflexi bacterium]|nr:hypothetical protein [Chloroflexota bacterium]
MDDGRFAPCEVNRVVQGESHPPEASRTCEVQLTHPPHHPRSQTILGPTTAQAWKALG